MSLLFVRPFIHNVRYKLLFALEKLVTYDETYSFESDCSITETSVFSDV